MVISTGMKILFIVLLVFSTPQENQGLYNTINRNLKEDLTYNNETEMSRAKRYATHMNSLLKNFNFFNNDGKN